MKRKSHKRLHVPVGGRNDENTIWKCKCNHFIDDHFILLFRRVQIRCISAARVNSFVPKDSVLLDQVEYPWGKVFIFDSTEKPITAISFKSFGFLWVSRMSTYYFHNNDPIKTIGGVIYSDDKGRAATVLSILLNDPQISYLEVGPNGSRLRKKAELNVPITFSWDKSFPWNDFNAKAFNENGKVLYEYRYPETNYIRSEDLKWYPVSAKSAQGD